MTDASHTRLWAPTLGWDIVYAVDADSLNAALADSAPQPVALAQPAEGAEIRCEIGRWSISEGGSGPLLYLHLDIANGTLSTAAGTVAFDGHVVVAAQLALYGQAASVALRVGTGPSAQPSDAGSAAGDAGNALTVERSHFHPPLPLAQRALVEATLEDWLGAHPEHLQQVLARIDISPMESHVAHAWLRPTRVSYAYADRPGGGGVLALLAMTNDRPPPLHDNQVSAAVIPPGRTAAMLISPHLMLDWIIRPGLADLYRFGDASALVLEDDPPRLTLRSPQAIPAIVDGGQARPAELTALAVTFTGSELICDSEVRIDKDAVWDVTAVHSRHALEVEHDASGKPMVRFVEACTPTVTQTSVIKIDVVEKSRAVAGAVILVGTVLAFLVSGPLSVAILVLAATTAGIIEAVPIIEYYFDRTEPHPVDLMALNVAAPFAWDGGAAFELESVDLAESLRISGTPWSAAA